MPKYQTRGLYEKGNHKNVQSQRHRRRETEDLVRNMMEEKLGIIGEYMKEIRFKRVHRLPTRHNSQTRSKPKPIIAKFSFMRIKNM